MNVRVKVARWFADDLAMAVGFHTASGVASGATSAESSAQDSVNYPGNIHATVGQFPGSGQEFSMNLSVTVHSPRSVHVRVQTTNSPQPHIAVIAFEIIAVF